MDYDFKIVIDGFNKGLSPLAHIDNQTFLGDSGQASDMKADIISLPGYVTQSPALANLTNGTQAGVVSELIRFILEQPIGTETYALSATKIFKLNATTVISGGSPSWPQAVTDMTEGEALIRMGAYLYGFYNKSSGGDILRLTLADGTLDPDWGTTVVVGGAALQKAAHPVASKEDIVVFGNGQYLGVFIEGLATIEVNKLDFGAGAEVADVVFNAGFWWIAVNYGDRRSQIFMYDGSALSNILSDEAGVGAQKIGFLYVLNGTLYVAYTDSTSGAFTIGYLSGRALKELRYFTGALPNHRQKSLYKKTIIFVSSTDIWSCGASVSQLPIQISKLADGGYATVGAIAAPFGVPLVASSDGGSNHRLAKFDTTYSLDSIWYSIFNDVTDMDRLGKVSKVIVFTKPLGADAKARLKLEGRNGHTDGIRSSGYFEITGTNKTKHTIKSMDLVNVEDARVVVDYSVGNATNPCPIRRIILLGNYVEV